MTLLLALIEIVKRNRLTCLDRMLQLSEVPDLSVLRPDWVVRPR